MMSEDQRRTEACERHLMFPSIGANRAKPANAPEIVPPSHFQSDEEPPTSWKLDPFEPSNALSIVPAIRDHTPSEEAIDFAAQRILDQMIMDQFVLSLAKELGWNEASSLFLQQQRRARFRLVDQSTQAATESASTFIPSNAEPKSDDEPNARRQSFTPPRATGGENRVVAEKENRDGERCSCGPDLVVRPPVADHLIEVRGPFLLRANPTSALLITSSAH